MKQQISKPRRKHKPHKKHERQPGSNPIGQPTVMTEVLQEKILRHIAGGGTITSYCRKHKYPNQDTVFNFLAKESGEKFAEAVARARERGTHAIAEHVLTITDDKTIDPVRAKLMADVRLRLIAQWNRRTYGVKQDLDPANRLTLAELVEAAMRQHMQSQPLLDITPPAPPVNALEHTQQPVPVPLMVDVSAEVSAPPRAARRTAS